MVEESTKIMIQLERDLVEAVVTATTAGVETYLQPKSPTDAVRQVLKKFLEQKKKEAHSPE